MFNLTSKILSQNFSIAISFFISLYNFQRLIYCRSSVQRPIQCVSLLTYWWTVFAIFKLRRRAVVCSVILRILNVLFPIVTFCLGVDSHDMWYMRSRRRLFYWRAIILDLMHFPRFVFLIFHFKFHWMRKLCFSKSSKSKHMCELVFMAIPFMNLCLEQFSDFGRL